MEQRRHEERGRRESRYAEPIYALLGNGHGDSNKASIPQRPSRGSCRGILIGLTW